MSSINEGHVKEARAARWSGISSLAAASPVASLAGATAPTRHQQQQQQAREKLAVGYRTSWLYYEQRQHRGRMAQCFSKRVAHNVRLLSIISLIVISMLSRDCTARAFLGVGARSGNQQDATSDDNSAFQSYNSAPADKQEQRISLASGGAGPGPLDFDDALELGCRHLVASILYPQLARPKDQLAAMEFIEFMDNERIKRISPKHTPRFGR